jgi:hypothetical protein
MFLIGNVFSKDSGFLKVKELEKVDAKVYIMDCSEVGVVFKHKAEMHSLLENVVILGRSGYLEIEDLRIAYLNGSESQKFMSEIDKFKYTGSSYSRDDVDGLLNDREELKVDLFILNTIPGVIYDELIK